MYTGQSVYLQLRRSDATNGAIVVFSFSNDAAVAHTLLDTDA